jgi:hypothetical protein
MPAFRNGPVHGDLGAAVDPLLAADQRARAGKVVPSGARK